MSSDPAGPRPARPGGRPIGRTLAMTAKAVGQAFNAALAAEGGSAPVWLTLNALTRGHSATQLELARALRIEGPTMARHLDNMERAGFVVRTRSETDRRAVRVELTDAGRAAHERMRGAVIAFDRRLRDGLSSDDVRRLEETLARLAENVGVARPEGSVVHKAS